MDKKVFHPPYNKVVVFLNDKRLYKGFIDSLDPKRRSFRISLSNPRQAKTPADSMEISYQDTNSIFFIKDYNIPAPFSMIDLKEWQSQSDGKPNEKVSISRENGKGDETFFKDSETYHGLFLKPYDMKDNIIQIFVPFASKNELPGDKMLGETLVKEGIISSRELIQSLDRQKTLQEKRIGDIFVEQGIVKHSELPKALKAKQADPSKKIGEILVAADAITPEQLNEALSQQRKNRNKRLGRILIGMGLINEEMLAIALALRHKLPYVDLNSYTINPLAISSISSDLAMKFSIIPLELEQNILTVGFCDPTNLDAKSDLSFHTGLKINEVITSQHATQKAIMEYYGNQVEEIPDIELFIGSLDKEEVEVKKGVIYDMNEKIGKEKPIIALVNHILKAAVSKKASDIHVIPQTKKVKVYLRIDGILYEQITFRIDTLPSVIARMKILSNMDIAERRVPQDGKARIRLGQKSIDLRFSCIPTIHGESMVVRLLDKEAGLIELDSIGFFPEETKVMRQCLSKRYGMILITGPTGSGKSSTIYACLQEPIFSGKNVITLEDPVEYEISGISQVQIKEKIGMTFARGLRNVLRHDPDVIVVGEIRDLETAKISLQASLTGHLLMSTLHTNTAAEAFVRLIDIGIESYLVSSSILAVLSQRLIRRVCTNCLEVDPDGSEKLRMSHFPATHSEGAQFYKGKGCNQCNYTGYKGRTAVYELLPITEDIKRAIIKQESSSVIHKLAVKNGMKTLAQTALQKAEQGITSVEEIIPLASELTLNE
jgi:type IV pilus assembly protein PilB